LVVEDDNPTRLLLRKMLEELQFSSVDTAAGVESAKLAFQTTQDRWPSIVLCDVNMKPTNGLEFVAWLKSQPMAAVRSIPIVMVTAHADASIVRRAMELGVSGYLVKPVKEGPLRTRMERALMPRAF
jgi:two-component system chemotaxis response regulator CheY